MFWPSMAGEWTDKPAMGEFHARERRTVAGRHCRRFSTPASRALDPELAFRIGGYVSVACGADQRFGGFRTPEMTREQSMGRVFEGQFEVGPKVLLIIL
jgi:hypothetical protein